VLFWKEGGSRYTACTVVDLTGGPSGANVFAPIDIDLAPQTCPWVYPVYSAIEECFVGE
jgi:hypothetical protein